MKRIIAIVLVFISLQAFSQTDNSSSYTWFRYLYGNKSARMWADSIMRVPMDTAVLAGNGSIAIVGSDFYIKNAGRWLKFHASDSTILSVNIETGYGLLGGPIIDTGTILVDTSLISTKYYADSVGYTDAKARAALSATSPIVYNSSTGAFTLSTVPINKGGTGLSTIGSSGKILMSDGSALYYFTPNWLAAADTASLSARIDARHVYAEAPLYFRSDSVTIYLNTDAQVYNARYIMTIPIQTGTPSNGDGLMYDQANNEWVYTPFDAGAVALASIFGWQIRAKDLLWLIVFGLLWMNYRNEKFQRNFMLTYRKK